MATPVHLYVKTHSQTGLKYFGRTSRNPYTYEGSGAYWTRHLQLYGDENVSTVVVGTFVDEDRLREAALEFSQSNRIDESPEWANLLLEDGSEHGFGWHPSLDFSARIRQIDAAVAANTLKYSNPQTLSVPSHEAPVKRKQRGEFYVFYWCLGVFAFVTGIYFYQSGIEDDSYPALGRGIVAALAVICTPIGWLPAFAASWIIEKTFK